MISPYDEWKTTPPRETEPQRCPICGSDEYDDLYVARDGETVGCDRCVTKRRYDE